MFTFFSWYAKRLETHPLLTKGITSGIIAATGDVICQSLSSDTTWDVVRAGRFGIMGACWVAPMTHNWYQALSTRIVPGTATGWIVAQRLLLDQFVFAPLFVPSFMAGLWTLEGRGVDPTRLLQVAPAVVQANWALWIPAMTINFAMVPLPYQVLYSNMVALVWNAYLSWVNAQSKEAEHENGGTWE